MADYEFTPRSDASGPSQAATGMARGRMLSLGMNRVQSQNNRFRPQPKVSDYPFDGASPGPSPGHGPEGNAEQLEYSPRRNEYYKKFVEHDRVSLAQQKAELEAELEKQRMRAKIEAANKEMDMPAMEALGVSSAHPYASLDTPRTEPDSSRDKKSRATEYMLRLDADANSVIQPTRAPYVRAGLVDYDPLKPQNYMPIGAQTDKDTLRRVKREGQAAYQQQLATDLMTKAAVPERQPVVRVHSPPSSEPDPFDKLGASPDRRAQARVILEANRDELLQRLNVASPEERQKRRHGQFSRADEIARFEEAPYIAIGSANEESASRARRKAMQEQYLQQLLTDNPSSPGKERPGEEMLYNVQRTVHAGASGGGGGGDKAQKQAAYKQMLDQQQAMKGELTRRDGLKYGKY
mmetsp:Transcript_24611/g.53221  ORF Transcript_24611/g.53221 Transcript_24611/m.53221 type:complete len:408 (-) Transcript_24611:285-1508(-)